MPETIPDVVLRLARRHLPADAIAIDTSARPEPEMPERPSDLLAPRPRHQPEESVDERVPTASSDPRPAAESPDHIPVSGGPHPHASIAELATPEPFGIPAGRPPQLHEPANHTPHLVVQASRLPSAGGTPAPQSMTSPQADESSWASSDTESFANVEPGVSHVRLFREAASFPPLGRGGQGGSRPISIHALHDMSTGGAGFPFDDSFQPADRSTTTAGSSPDQSPVEAVSETSRQLEQTARDLETSLTHLFTTQIETLQRLRDRVDEQERRWVEQQSARRAAL